MISVVSPRGTLHFTVFFGRFNAAVFVEFLTKLMHDAPGPVYLILDNLSVHKAKIVKDYVDSLEGRLKLFFLPGYSPKLNPDEWVWKNVKHDHVGKMVARTRDELKDGVEKAINRLQRLPEIVCGFFRDPDLSYIHL